MANEAKKAESITAPKGESTLKPVASQRKRPLVYFVDDEPDILDFFDSYFSEKFQVATFPSGFELVEQIKANTVKCPDLIVTDLRMAKMDGVQMLTTLNTLGYDIPAILLSGNLDKSSAVEALNIGVFRILEKPFEPVELESYINELLLEGRIYKVRVEVRQHVRQLTELYQAMRLLLAERIPDFEKILDEVMSDAGQDEHFDTIVSRLEHRLDELLKVEEITEALQRKKH